MKYSKINHTDLTASKIILGTDGFGSEMSKELSFKMLDAFIENGGNIIDTASFYADWLNMGKSLSEKTIGEWLFERKNRDKIIISTKGGHPRNETMHISRLSRAEIFDDFENSLVNLKTDYIDIYWLHKDDESIPPEELIGIMNEILETGKARYIAVSNWSYDRIKKANDYASTHSLKPFIASQIQYSLAKINEGSLAKLVSAMTESEYEKYIKDDLNIFAFSSQAKGFFAQLESGGVEAINPAAKKEFLNDYNLALFDRLKKVADDKKTSVSAVILATLTSNDKLNTYAQIGPRKLEYLFDSLRCTEFNLSNEEMNYIIG